MATKKKKTEEQPVEEPQEEGVELEMVEVPHIHFVSYVTKRPEG